MGTIGYFKKRKLIQLFYFTIWAPIISAFLSDIHTLEFLSDILSFVDELFILYLIWVAITHSLFKLDKVVFITLIFIFSGILSGLVNNVDSKVIILGLISTCKAIVLFLVFRNIDFNEDDIFYFIRLFSYSIYILVIGEILDLLIPNFRVILGCNPEDISSRTRFGMRPLSGFFRYTHITILSFILYFIHKYYVNSRSLYNKIAALCLLFTLKIKDIVGFVVNVVLTRLKKIKTEYIFIFVFLFYGLFVIYSIALPEHYELYFGEGMEDSTARTALYFASLLIAKDYFPFGTGFGTFASPTSQQFESPVYSYYQIDHIYGLNYDYNSRFMADTFWPMILGENGVMGFITYVMLLYVIFSPYIIKFLKDTTDIRYLLPTVLFFYSLISSFAKPVFSGPPFSFLVFGIAGLFYNYAFNKINLLEYDE